MEKDKDSIYMTDINNYAIGKSNVIWIWNKEDLSKEKIIEMLNILEKTFLTKNNNTITCRKEIYDELKKRGDTSNKKELCYLECKVFGKHETGQVERDLPAVPAADQNKIKEILKTYHKK